MANAIAIVSSLEGQAWAKATDGTLRPLKVGDAITAEEVVITAAGAHIELDFGDGKPVAIAGDQEVTMDASLWTELAADKQDAAVEDASLQEALTVLNNGGDLTTELDETAAGLSGGGANEGHSFVTLTRVVETTGSNTFVFKTDSNGAEGASSPSINPVNHAPQLTPQSFVGDEDTLIVGQVVATDLENDVLSYTLIGQPTSGTISLDSSTGSFVYTPSANYHGPDSFLITVTDDHGNSSSTTISLTVNSVNDLPVSVDQNLTTPEDTPIPGQIVATDVDGDTLSYVITSTATHGTVSLNPTTGDFVYTPSANYNGSDKFVVTISDGQGGTTTSTINIGVTPVNDTPVSANQNLTTPEDTPINGAVVASDVDGDTLSYSVSSTATHGTISLNPTTGAFVYRPGTNYNGSDKFVVTISDGQGGTTTSTINIGVTPVNDTPVSADQNLTTPEDTPINGAVIASDVDGDTLSYAVSSTAINGAVTLDPTTGAFVYTPSANYNGSDKFVVTISDGQGGTTTSTINIGVTPVNDAPVSADQNLTTPEDTPINGAVVASDVDGDTLSYTISSTASNGTVTLDPTTGAFVYTPSTNYNGSDKFIVTISDGQGGTTTSTINIGVTPVNDAPVSADQNLTTPEDTPINGAVVASDVDGDTLGYSVSSTATHGTVSLNPTTGAFVYAPSANYNGSDKFIVTISDGQGGAITSTINIGVTPVNDAPVSADQNLTTPEDTPINGAVVASDVDGDTLGYSVSSTATHGTVSLNPTTGAFVYAPSANYNGSDKFIVTISDGQGGATTSTINIGVTPVNDAPASSNLNLTTPEDIPVSDQVSATDVDGDSLSFSVSGNPANGSVVINPATGSFTYTPNANYNGSDSFVVTISDGNGGTTTSVVSIGITPVNDAPVASNLNLTTDENTAVPGSISASDSDGDTLSFSVTGSPANGTVVLNTATGTFTYTPSTGYSGSDSFVVTISDGKGGTTTSTVNIGVNAVNNAPTANTDTATTNEATAVTVAVRGNDTDPDGDSLTVSGVTQGANGSVVIDAVSGDPIYTPNAGFVGSDSFTYTISDSNGGTATATVNVTVNAVVPVNSAPVATADTLTVAEGGTATTLTGGATSVLTNDTDANGDPLTAVLVSGPANGTLTLNPNGTFSYIHNGSETTTDKFTYKVNDSTVDGNTVTVTINVTPVNDAPVANNDTATVNEDDSVTIPVRINDTDAEGNSLTVTGVTQGANGSVVIDAVSGNPIYTPNAGYSGSDSFTYTISDGNGGTATATVNVTVNPAINNAPVAVADMFTVAEGGTLTGAGANVLTNDTDADGNPLTAILVTGPANGTLILNANGTFSYTHNGSETTSDSFTYKVNDGTIDGNTVTVTIGVTPVNDAPVAVADSITIAEGGTATILVDGATSVLANDTDAEGNSLTAILVTGPANGTLTLNADGTFTYIHNGSETTTDSFTYKVNDGTVDGNTVTVTINVTPVNDAPVANNDTATTSENTAITVAVRGNDTDPEGDSLTVTGVTQGANGSVVIDAITGNPIYTPNTNFKGTDSFTYTINDGHGGAASATVNVTVNPVNHAPVAVNDTAGTGTAYSAQLGDANASDLWTSLDSKGLGISVNAYTASGSVGSIYIGTIDGNAHTIGVTGTPRVSRGEVNLIEYDPTTGKSEALEVVLNGNVNQAGFSVSRLYANENGGEIGMWSAYYQGTLVAQSSFKLSGALNAGSFNINSGGLVFDSVKFTALNTAYGTGDGGDYFLTGFSATGSASLNSSYTLAEGGSLNIGSSSNFRLLANDTDSDGDSLVVTKINNTNIADGDSINLTYGSLVIHTDGSFSYSANNAGSLSSGQVGTDSFNYTISDGHGGTSTATASITVIGRDLTGTSGNDTLIGGAYSEQIVGGRGNDTMTGGLGADTFKWSLNEQGSKGSPAVDTITDFSTAQGDRLDLRDLLQNENSGNLSNYLHFTSDGANTTVSVSSTGSFNGSNYATATDQTIILNGVVDLTGSDSTIINLLKTNGNLITD